MTWSEGAVRTRRAVLLGAFGAAGALVAQAIGRPEVANAATDSQAVHKGVNNPTSNVTTITNSAGSAIKGVTNTSTQNQAGVVGVSNSPHASGVFGQGVFGVSGFGSGNTGAGIIGNSSKAGGAGAWGINQATTGDAVGVKGDSHSAKGIGVLGIASSALGTERRGVVGQGGDVGVVGDGDTGLLGLGAAIGVDASVINPDGIGVRADVHDLGPNAVAGHFIGGGSNKATGLLVQGPVSFVGAAGISVIANGDSFVVVDNVHCPPGAKLLATLMDLPGIGNHVAVQVAKRVNNTSFQIQLTGPTSASVEVAWFIIL